MKGENNSNNVIKNFRMPPLFFLRKEPIKKRGGNISPLKKRERCLDI
jgi:hypothetical protein